MKPETREESEQWNIMQIITFKDNVYELVAQEPKCCPWNANGIHIFHRLRHTLDS
jgi:hypothetical protein